MLRNLLNREGVEIGHRHVATLMKRVGVEAICGRPNTSKPAPGQQNLFLSPARLQVGRPNQVWAMDITYTPRARGFVYLAASLTGSAGAPHLSRVDHDEADFELCRGAGGSPDKIWRAWTRWRRLVRD